MSPLRSRNALCTAVLVALATIGAGCADEGPFPSPPPHAASETTIVSTPGPPGQDRAPAGARTFAGAVDTTGTSLSVHVTDDDVAVHLCQGVETSEHLDGVVRGDGVIEASAPAGTFLVAEIDGDHVTGLVTFPDSSEHSFSARRRGDPRGSG